MSDGPVLNFRVNGANISDNITVDTGGNVSLFFEWKSTAEFGSLSSIRIYKGMNSSSEELLVKTYSPSNYGGNKTYSNISDDEWLRVDENSYYRLEGETSTGKRVYTNLIKITTNKGGDLNNDGQYTNWLR